MPHGPTPPSLAQLSSSFPVATHLNGYHICHIRQKLDLPAEGEGSIRSVVKVGYSLVKQWATAASSTMAQPDGALQRTA